MRKKEIVKVNKNELRKELEKELVEDYEKAIKQKAKKLLKEIRMTEILLKKQKEKLDDYLSGRIEISEEEVLYND